MEAKLIAARLGAEGIVWELRGSVDGPFALGPIDVLVDADDIDDARALLLIDELEATLAPRPEHETHAMSVRDVLVVGVVLALVLLFALARMGARI